MAAPGGDIVTLSLSYAANAADSHNDQLPRTQRRPKRAKADRGLPSDRELVRLSAAYLNFQRPHWVEVCEAGLLPEATPDVTLAMVEEFKQRHRTGQIDPKSIEPFRKFSAKLAGAYQRFSCDNSSPNSIIDQMINVLEKARAEGRFIPWGYLFCDYSESGTNPSRQGFGSYKNILKDANHFIETTYIDDFTRASRDEIEWWRLATMSRRLQKRMIGASDGFDLSAADWDLKITMYGLLSRLFLKGLREKVRRGMRGAARRQTCLGKMSLGFTRRPRRDENGNILTGADGHAVNEPCIDPATVGYRRLLFELFTQQCWSVYRITQHFNAERIENWDGWTEGTIKKLLWSPTAIGVFIWNRTRSEFDRETEKWIVLANPRSEWEVSYNRDLAIVPMDQWRAARRKLAAMRRKSPLTGRTMSRNQKSATTLFSGTLFCGYCGKELVLNRSAGKYKVFSCFNGRVGGHGCELTCSKSAGIIETSLLSYLQGVLVTDQSVGELVAEANAHLADIAKMPKTDTKPIKTAIRDKEETIKKLLDRIEKCIGNDDLIQEYEQRITTLRKQANESKLQLREAETCNEPPPTPLDPAAAISLVKNLRGLLNEEIPAAAEALRALTGSITIRQEKVPGQTKGARWIATFSPDLIGWIRKMVQCKDYPESITLEYLCRRIWITPRPVEVRLHAIPAYERFASEAVRLSDKGTSIETIGRALGINWSTARDALAFGKAGRRSRKYPTGKKTRKRDGPPKYVAIAAEVAQLRDDVNVSFKKIAKRLRVAESTVTRAYDLAHPESIRDAANKGNTPKRGRYSNLGSAKIARLRNSLASDLSKAQIAKQFGCSVNTVYREAKHQTRAA